MTLKDNIFVKLDDLLYVCDGQIESVGECTCVKNVIPTELLIGRLRDYCDKRKNESSGFFESHIANKDIFCKLQLALFSDETIWKLYQNVALIFMCDLDNYLKFEIRITSRNFCLSLLYVKDCHRDCTLMFYFTSECTLTKTEKYGYKRIKMQI